jgi:hypothetical protein
LYKYLFKNLKITINSKAIFMIIKKINQYFFENAREVLVPPKKREF